MTPDECKDFRKRLKLKRSDLARLLKVSHSTVSRWEDASVEMPYTVELAMAAIANGWPPVARGVE